MHRAHRPRPRHVAARILSPATWAVVDAIDLLLLDAAGLLVLAVLVASCWAALALAFL